jgi:septal ring factor EnvC (AmiA/AmiB activator)
MAKTEDITFLKDLMDEVKESEARIASLTGEKKALLKQLKSDYNIEEKDLNSYIEKQEKLLAKMEEEFEVAFEEFKEKWAVLIEGA